jgi:hypothetical protein
MLLNRKLVKGVIGHKQNLSWQELLVKFSWFRWQRSKFHLIENNKSKNLRYSNESLERIHPAMRKLFLDN